MNLSFMWHMHQPDYRNEDGIMQMPWVFLHAIKDYYDMPWMLSRYKNIQATFNITSPLIEQLKLYYKNPEQSDKFILLWLQNPSSLKTQERQWLVKICKSSQFDTMVKGLPRYEELYKKDSFSDDEVLDLEILFILSWCGMYLKENNLHVKSLINKEKNYTDEDKKVLLNELSKFIGGIWKFYKELYNEKRITISTTPFYHPILPLLLDMQNAKRANAHTQIPQNYEKLEEDALLHIQKAKDLFSDTFGYTTDVFWPAEGAVDEKSVKLLKSLGVNFIATDEEILYKSLNSKSKKLIYAPYNYNNMLIGFRDHTLSDLIGFEYRYKKAEDAAQNFMSQLQSIKSINDNATVFVILDGENAWEFYKNNGFDFFEALYSALEKASWCKTLTMDEVKDLPFRELINLAPGSWINGSFDTWVGEYEKTRAWELLFLTKKDYEHHKESLSDDIKAKITDNFLGAECSDWFWWYGSDHYTNFSLEFDAIFRRHLINIYNLIGISVPNDLFIPIGKNQSSTKFWIKPQSKITPKIDGKRDSFFEWMGCGVIDESKLFSTMHANTQPVKKIYYGQDDNKLYFAFEGDIKKLCKKGIINIIIDPLELSSTISFNQKKVFLQNIEIKLACKEWLEISLDKTQIKQKKIWLRFEIADSSGSLQTLPSFGELEIDLQDDYSKNWFI
ncbi:glycoside hydrolase family 57 protein [Sulfurimonas autotrophica]|uniref:Glycoside hydrolase family 57 n=1 Tax=Sulfurimonas autotrophica (strain ATCC BAA-671 / DSM 16294 / JCM 11897 / OK10) TaxID=563040 RepID=E0UP58_SULAO|nr:glycoside hydrolase family 57 protein [Sulfurimonas autotrophica]ADN08522.1 glycoside hydrolase family 57 [Sulfurimonas autotrophica DSM 16294]